MPEFTSVGDFPDDLHDAATEGMLLVDAVLGGYEPRLQVVMIVSALSNFLYDYVYEESRERLLDNIRLSCEHTVKKWDAEGRRRSLPPDSFSADS